MINIDPASVFNSIQPAPDPRLSIVYSEEHADLGIQRSMIEVFAVGPYKYSNLEDAISQAKRDGGAG